jgi:hypothetical protein
LGAYRDSGWRCGLVTFDHAYRWLGLARLFAIADTREQTMENARNGSISLKRFHSNFYDKIPSTLEGFMDMNGAFVGSVDEIRRKMHEVKEKMDPEYFMIDQGFLPIDTIQRQMELFGTKIMPGVLDWLAEPDRVAMVRKGGAIATATLEAKASTR